jgi:RNA polymerase sigma factor (sigma-70 family)
VTSRPTPFDPGREDATESTPVTPLRALDTQQLLVRAQSGDERACNVLYERYVRRLETWLRGRVPRHARGLHDTEGVSHEVLHRTLVHAVENREHMRVSFRAYLRRAMENRLVDLHRMARPVLVDLDPELSDDAPTAEELMIADAFERRVAAALRRLPGESQRALVLRFEHDSHYADVAHALGLTTADAARMRVNRALEEMRRLLVDDLC